MLVMNKVASDSFLRETVL